MTAYDAFKERIAQINDLCCVINLLTWDLRTKMPDGGAATRGAQLGTLARLAQERFTSAETLALIEAAEAEVRDEPDDSYRVRAVRQTREAYEVSRRIPVELMAEMNTEKIIAQKAWAEARAKNDFALFSPYLEKMIAFNRRIADAIGYAGHPYDALLYRYEPNMTVARLKTLFDELKQGLTPILHRAVASPEPRTDFLFERDYPADRQRAFILEILPEIGYDLNRGRLDETVHPFEISFTRQDVRITTRYHSDFLPAALFGAIHEAGHALYEQNADPALTRTALATDLLDLYAVAGTSYGTHESQSRLWENLVGRNRVFWQNHFDGLKAHFPEQLAGVDCETFYRAINRVKPSLIRVEADEVTYNFHIMLRVEIEIGLVEGSLKVKDLPEIWNAKMQSYLGITPPNNSLGVLQDIHWSTGYVGTFCTYTVGNVMSAQFFAAARRAVPGLDEALANANYRPLLSWLTENVYRHGRAFGPDELLRNATGSSLTTAPYLAYLTQKYGELYPLNPSAR